MAIKSLKELGGATPSSTTPNADISDVVLNKARKDYYDILGYLKTKGVKVDMALAQKIKSDVIDNQQILTMF